MKELCVTCNDETTYDRHDHIDYRIGYIEGAGQLCLNCFDKLYMRSSNGSKSNPTGIKKNKKRVTSDVERHAQYN